MTLAWQPASSLSHYFITHMPSSLLSQIAETYTLAGGLSTCSAASCHLVFCPLMSYCVPSDLTVALPRQDGSYPSTFAVPYARLKVILGKHSHPVLCQHLHPLYLIFCNVVVHYCVPCVLSYFATCLQYPVMWTPQGAHWQRVPCGDILSFVCTH